MNNPAAALAAMRKRGVITCEHCGLKTEALVRSRFCSKTCRYRHHNGEKAKAKKGKVA
jgi:hypothetical protein